MTAALNIPAPTAEPSPFTLSPDQKTAYDAFGAFVVEPTAKIFVLEGYAGTGKSTLVEQLLKDLDKFQSMGKLLNPHSTDWEIRLTATTNKACESLEALVTGEVVTIHSLLGLRVHTDFRNNTTTLALRKNAEPLPNNLIIIIDEASYIDHQLLSWIFKLSPGCKLVFIGDPAQLLQISSRDAPVFAEDFGKSIGKVVKAKLTKVMRQGEGSPILSLATAFRETVSTGQFFQFMPDGQHIQHLSNADFEKAVLAEFGRDDWSYHQSKVLAWRNKTVDQYNRGIRQAVQGEPDLKVGDYAVCNKYINNRNCNIRTDQMVRITHLSDSDSYYDTPGHEVVLDHQHVAFLPDSLDSRKAAIKQATAEGNTKVLADIDNQWIDLRAAYACTVNKSQGATFDKVFIDLSDIGACSNGNTIARMLYVAVSRARHQVIFTGDFA